MRNAFGEFLFASLLSVVGVATVVRPEMAEAQVPPTVTNTFATRLQDSANSGNLATGDILVFGAQSVTPSASPPSYGVAFQCPIGSTCTPSTPSTYTTLALFNPGWALVPDEWRATTPYSSLLTDPWGLKVSSSITMSPANVVDTPAVGNVGRMPYVQSMTVQGSGLTPTISWVLPSSPSVPIDNERVIVFNNTTPATGKFVAPHYQLTFTHADSVYVSPALASGSTLPTSFQIPSGVLQNAQTYSIAIELANMRQGASLLPECFNCSMDSESNSFFDFTPINGQTLGIGNAAVNLPINFQPIPTSSGLISDVLYHFNVGDVGPDAQTFIDPLVAIGYIYTTGAGDPNFKSVDAVTDVGDGIYALSVWDGTSWILADSSLAAGDVFDFTANGYSNGVSRFEITGIDPSAGLSPTDITAFVTGLTFMSEGSFTGTMEPIVAEVTVPEPATIALFGIGLAGLGFTRRKRTG